ncbi:hypothetical protein ACLMJK_006988 [Lecanora helva]
MLPSLILPPLLNASLTTPPSTTPLSTPLSAPTCWQQQPPGHHQLWPTIFRDCKASIAQIPLSGSGRKPLVFSHNPDIGFEVPHSWQSGNCVVEIDVVEDDVVETTSFENVVEEATRLAKSCVIAKPHLGGKVYVGKEGGLQIWVFGFGRVGGG